MKHGSGWPGRACTASARLAATLVACGLGVEVDEILEPGRGSRRTAFARQVAMYLHYIVHEQSLAQVALAFGRDRSTVSHACHAIEDKREEPVFDGWLGALEEALRQAVAAQNWAREDVA